MKIISFLHPCSHQKNRRYSEKSTKNKCVSFNEVVWLMTVKMRLKKENTSHKYDRNKPRPRHAQKHTKCKMCLNIMMVICIKQQLSNIWSSIDEKVKQRWGWVEKSVAYLKKRVIRKNIARCKFLQKLAPTMWKLIFLWFFSICMHVIVN